MGSRKAMLITIGILLITFASGQARGQTITQIIDATCDGTSPLDGPRGIALDGSNNVYVTARYGDNAFKVAPPPGGLSRVAEAGFTVP